MNSLYRVWFLVLLFSILKTKAEKTSPLLITSHTRQEATNEYVMLTFCQDSMCQEAVDLEWESLFQWQVCTFMPQMESYFWFEKTPYGKFYRICEDWMCLNCSLCGMFQSSSDTCIPMPYFNFYGRLEQVKWDSDPPTTSSDPVPSTSAQPDPTTTVNPTADPSSSPVASPTLTSTATTLPTDVPLSSHSGDNSKVGDHNATHNSSSVKSTPKPTQTPVTTTTSPLQSQPLSTKIHQGGLSAGSIAGIVIGSVAGGLVATGLTALFVRRRRRAVRNRRAVSSNLSVER